MLTRITNRVAGQLFFLAIRYGWYNVLIAAAIWTPGFAIAQSVFFEDYSVVQGAEAWHFTIKFKLRSDSEIPELVNGRAQFNPPFGRFHRLDSPSLTPWDVDEGSPILDENGYYTVQIIVEEPGSSSGNWSFKLFAVGATTAEMMRQIDGSGFLIGGGGGGSGDG